MHASRSAAWMEMPGAETWYNLSVLFSCCCHSSAGFPNDHGHRYSHSPNIVAQPLGILHLGHAMKHWHF
jgi:hypothetical protein